MTNNSTQYNNFLTNASVADAKHDFHSYSTILNYLANNRDSFAAGLPGKNNNYDILNEANTLASVFIKQLQAPPPNQYDDDDDSNNESKSIYSPLLYFQTTNDRNKKSNFLEHNIETINNKRFNVVGNTALNLSSISNDNDENKYIDAKDFIYAFNIKHNSALVIDATAISILTILKKGEKVLENGQWFTIFIIDDLETRNDPAGKSSWSSKYDKDTGINIIFLEPDDPRVVSYIYNYKDENPLNKFFTDYTFKLQTGINGEGCTLIIADKTGENVQINNPKEENAIEYVSSQIMEFLNIKNNTDIFKTNVKYQQKRSGDWLQVLLCLLLFSRTYKNSINNNEKYNRSDISNVYFMTHDRIALAYALFSGVDTLFTHGKSGTIMLFDLQKDPESLLNSELEDCKIIMEPYIEKNIEEFENKRDSYEIAYNKKKTELKNLILQNEFINELRNMSVNQSINLVEFKINLVEFKNKVIRLFNSIFKFYSFCNKLTPPENFKPVVNDSLSKISEQLQLLNQNNYSIENKLVESKKIKKELIEVVNNLKNIEQLCITDNVNNWQIPTNNPYYILISKLDFTGGGVLTKFNARTISSSVIKNTEMFNFLQVFPFLDNEIQYMLNDLFYNFSFIVPTLVFENYENSRTKEKPMMIVMSFCQEVMATFKHRPLIDDNMKDDNMIDDNMKDDNMKDDNMKDDNMIDDNMKDDNMKDDNMIDGSFEKIFKDTLLYNLKYVVAEQHIIIQEKIDSDTYIKNNSKKSIRNEASEEDADQMGIIEDVDYPLYKKQQYGGKKNDPFIYLNTERRKKILKYYLENKKRSYSLNKLTLYMVGISMIHQLENENIYESLDYDTYKLLYEILFMFYIEKNDSIHLDNLFFGLSNNKKDCLAIDLSYQLGKYFDLNVYNFSDTSNRSVLLQKIQKLEHSYSSDNLFSLKDYNKFYIKVCSLVNEIGDEIYRKIREIEKEINEQIIEKEIISKEVVNDVAKGLSFAPQSPYGVDNDFSQPYFAGKKKIKNRTIKKQKRNNKKTKKTNKINKRKTRKHSRKHHRKSIKNKN